MSNIAIDWSKYMQGLQGKANTALDNISGTTDVVIEYKVNSDGSWYRKYKSGWIEQGGFYAEGASGNNSGCTDIVNLPIQVIASKSYGMASCGYSGGSSWNGPYVVVNPDGNTIEVTGWVVGQSRRVNCTWIVYGFQQM